MRRNGRRSTARAELLVFLAALAGCQCGPKQAVADVTVDFGAVVLGETATRPLEVPNASDASLEVTALEAPSGGFAVKFTKATVQPRGTVTYPATFAPAAAGPAEQVLRLTTSRGESLVTLKGSGVMKPVACAAPEVVDFGAARPGDVVTRAASLPGGRLISGDVSVFTVRSGFAMFSPVAVGRFEAVAAVTQPAGCPSQVRLVGEAFVTPLSCVPDPLDFGAVNPGASRRLDVTVHNAHDFETALSFATTDSFRVVSDPVIPIPAHSDARVTVEFTPRQLGPVSGVLTAAGLSCALQGSGGGGDIDVSPSLAMGRIPYFATASNPSFLERNLPVRNTGAGLLTVTKLEVSSLNADSVVGDISVPQGGFTVPPGGVVQVPVRVTPHGKNLNLQWRVTVTSDDLDEPMVAATITAQSVELPPCNYSTTPVALSFGRLAPPEVRELTLRIQNLGLNASEVCLVTALELAPGSHELFSLPNGPVYQRELMPAEALDVVVRAAPASVGPTLVTAAGALRFGISSPTVPQRSVALSAQLGAGCLVVGPRELHFGSVELGCASSSRTVSVFNTCASPVPVSGVVTSTPEVSATLAPGTSVAPGGSLSIPVAYRPSTVGADTGRVLVQSQQDAVLVEDLVTFDGAGNSDGANTDAFVVTPSRKADLLFVVDNSCSMADDQTRLSTNTSMLMQKLLGANLDFHVGVTPADCVLANTGALLGAPAVLTSATPGVAATFTTRINVGLNGVGNCPVDAAIKAITAPLINTTNAGFLRPDATFTAVMISDDDTPLQPVAAQALQLERARSRLFYFGPFGGCGGAITGGAQALTNTLGGVTADLCAADWGPALDEIVRRASGLSGTFVLTTDPIGPITVEVDGFIVLPVSGALTVWTFDAATRTLAFEPLFRPGPGSTVRVTYNTACN